VITPAASADPALAAVRDTAVRFHEIAMVSGLAIAILVYPPAPVVIKLLVVFDAGALLALTRLAETAGVRGADRLAGLQATMSAWLLAAILLLFVDEGSFYLAALVLGTSNLLVAIGDTHRSVRLPSIYAAAALFAFAVAEGVMGGSFPFGAPSTSRYDKSAVTSAGQWLPSGTRSDSLLGFGAVPSSRVEVRVHAGARVLFEARYTIGADGWREAPARAEKPLGLVPIFGDSFAFGEGVQDGETLGAWLEEDSHPHLKTANFGYIGYGPHQALALLQHNRESDRIGRGLPVVAGIYFSAVDTTRSAGLAAWDSTGPRYVLNAVGLPVYRGSFSDSRPLRLLAVAKKSFVLRRAVAQLGSDSDVVLYAAILGELKKLFEERYHAPLVVVLWEPQGDAVLHRLLIELKERGVHPVTPREILPDWPSRRADHLLPDGHPKAQTQKLVADYILSRVVERQTTVSP
jgi:hypothetical protein